MTIQDLMLILLVVWVAVLTICHVQVSKTALKRLSAQNEHDRAVSTASVRSRGEVYIMINGLARELGYEFKYQEQGVWVPTKKKAKGDVK